MYVVGNPILNDAKRVIQLAFPHIQLSTIGASDCTYRMHVVTVNVRAFCRQMVKNYRSQIITVYQIELYRSTIDSPTFNMYF